MIIPTSEYTKKFWCFIETTTLKTNWKRRQPLGHGLHFRPFLLTLAAVLSHGPIKGRRERRAIFGWPWGWIIPWLFCGLRIIKAPTNAIKGAELRRMKRDSVIIPISIHYHHPFKCLLYNKFVVCVKRMYCPGGKRFNYLIKSRWLFIFGIFFLSVLNSFTIQQLRSISVRNEYRSVKKLNCGFSISSLRLICR